MSSIVYLEILNSDKINDIINDIKTNYKNSNLSNVLKNATLYKNETFFPNSLYYNSLDILQQLMYELYEKSENVKHFYVNKDGVEIPSQYHNEVGLREHTYLCNYIYKTYVETYLSNDKLKETLSYAVALHDIGKIATYIHNSYIKQKHNIKNINMFTKHEIAGYGIVSTILHSNSTICYDAKNKILLSVMYHNIYNYIIEDLVNVFDLETIKFISIVSICDILGRITNADITEKLNYVFRLLQLTEKEYRDIKNNLPYHSNNKIKYLVGLKKTNYYKVTKSLKHFEKGYNYNYDRISTLFNIVSEDLKTDENYNKYFKNSFKQELELFKSLENLNFEDKKYLTLNYYVEILNNKDVFNYLTKYHGNFERCYVFIPEELYYDYSIRRYDEHKLYDFIHSCVNNVKIPDLSSIDKIQFLHKYDLEKINNLYGLSF